MQCVVFSVSKLHEHKGFRHFWKLWWNLCAFRGLRTTGNRDFKPYGSKILYMLFWTRWMKENSPLLNSDIDSEFLILIPKENQLFKVEGKKEYLK